MYFDPFSIIYPFLCFRIFPLLPPILVYRCVTVEEIFFIICIGRFNRLEGKFTNLIWLFILFLAVADDYDFNILRSLK